MRVFINSSLLPFRLMYYYARCALTFCLCHYIITLNDSNYRIGKNVCSVVRTVASMTIEMNDDKIPVEVEGVITTNSMRLTDWIDTFGETPSHSCGLGLRESEDKNSMISGNRFNSILSFDFVFKEINELKWSAVCDVFHQRRTMKQIDQVMPASLFREHLSTERSWKNDNYRVSQRTHLFWQRVLQLSSSLVSKHRLSAKRVFFWFHKKTGARQLCKSNRSSMYWQAWSRCTRRWN